MSFVLGIDIGGTHIRLGLVNKECQLFDFTQIKTNVVFKTNCPVDDLLGAINDYLGACGEHERVRAISIGFPSTIDKEVKTVLSTPNVPTLQNVRVVDELSEKLTIPIYLNRDVNFLMLFDIHQQKLNTDGVVLGFYFGTGIGNSIFIDGKPLRGKTGVTAELGHIPMVGDPLPCTCGSIGCLENHASGRHLMTLLENDFKGTDVSEIFTLHVAHPKVMTFIENMAIAIALEVSLLDPEYIVLGGGILQMKDFPKDRLEARIKERARKPFPSESLEIMYANEGQENGVIGAGLYAFQQLLASGKG